MRRPISNTTFLCVYIAAFLVLAACWVGLVLVAFDLNPFVGIAVAVVGGVGISKFSRDVFDSRRDDYQ